MDDWGALNVADVIDGDVDSSDTKEDLYGSEARTSCDEAGAPFFLLDAAFVPELQRAMLSNMKRWLSARSTHIERVFAIRFRKLKVSLTSSRQIRQRLSETIALMGLSLPVKGEHITLLSTIALLGALTNSEEAEAYTSALLDGLAHVNWELTSPQSCRELFHMLETHSTEDALTEDAKTAVARAKHDLALRSGRLSLLLSCLLAEGSVRKLGPELFPCKAASRGVCVSATTISSFLVKTLVLPAHFRMKDPLHCFSTEGAVRFVGSSHSAQFEAMGTMETRFLQRSTELLTGDRSDVVLYVNPTSVLRIKTLGRDKQDWHFSTHFDDSANKKKKYSGRLAFRTSGLSLSTVRFHFCLSEVSALCCMVSSHPPQRTRGSIYVGDVSLSALQNAASRDEVVTMELKPLFRNPVLNRGPGMYNAFHFTKSVSVSIGRITLKELFHPFCIEMWVYPRSVEKDQTFLSIGDKGVDEVLLGLEPVGNGMQWRGGSRTPRLGSSFATFTSPGKLAVLERWWHLALNFDGATWELWLDHELVSRQPALVSPQAIEDAKCVVGKNFIGMAAEVRIWQHTRTGAQLIRDARRPLSGAEDGLCGYFPFNEGHGNIIMDYAPHREHALLPLGEPYWCAVDTFPVLADLHNVLYVADFVPLAWIEETDEMFFAASSESYTVAGVRSDHTLCVFDYACDDRCLVSQRTVELPSPWSVKSISSHASRASLVCCAVTAKSTAAAGTPETSATVQVYLWEMWSYVGYVEAPSSMVHPSTWACGKAVLARSARHAQRFLTAMEFLTDQSSWAASVPPFLLDQDDAVLPLLLRLGRHALAATPQQDLTLAQQASCLLELNLLSRFYHSPQRFAERVGQCYTTVEQLLQSAENDEEDSEDSAARREICPTQLREAITRLAFQPAFAQPSSSALLRCCCQCFLEESSRVEFLEKHAGRQRAPARNTVYACLLSLYSSLHISYDLLASLPAERLSALFAALFREAMFYVEHAFRERSAEGLQRTSHCLEVMAEVLLAGGGGAMSGADVGGEAVRREALQCAFSIALLKCCGKIVDAVAAALRQNHGAESTLLRCLQLSPTGALLGSFSVSLPLLPTSALEACASLLQQCRESLLVLMDQFSSEEGKRWASRVCVAITYSVAQLGCALLDPRPTAQQLVSASHAALLDTLASPSSAAQPAYLNLLRNGQRKPNTERDSLIKNLQGGVGAISKVFDEIQRKDVSALRVARDDELREMERQVMAACCALLLPTSAMREASKESLQPAFQLVLKLRPWVLSRRQESKTYVATVRERAVFLALFEPIAETEEDDVAAATHPSVFAGSAVLAKRTAKAITEPHTARAAERKRWRKLFKSWKAMRELKALMASHEDMADVNASAEVMSCFQSEVSTAEMKTVLSWRSEKAKYRFVGLQLLWELTEEACRSVVLARVLHPVIARALCGWHYADGVEGCSVEQLSRLQSAFFHLIRASVKAYTVAKETQPWGLLLSALLSCPFRRTDLRKLPQVGLAAELLYCLWGSEESREVLYQRVNGNVPPELRMTKLTPEGCASTMTVGATGLTLRSSGGRGSCVALCNWTVSQRRQEKRSFTYYYEVHVIDVFQGGYVSIGLGPADYSLSQMPGWDPDSFAYDGFEGSIYANRSPRVIGSTFGMGDIVGCGWNTNAGEIFWTRNGKLVHSLKTTPSTAQLSPLIGMKGQGCVLVNFGASPFSYQTWPSASAASSSQLPFSRAMPNNSCDAAGVVRDGWDAFRLFSIRAATTLAAAYNQKSEVSAVSLSELAQPVGVCFDALATALAPASAAPRSQCTLPARFMTTLLGHLTLLCKLLRGVPDGVVAPHTSTLAAMLKATTTRWLLITPFAVVFNEDENEAVMALLTAWYHTMYLTPPYPSAPAPSTAPTPHAIIPACSATTAKEGQSDQSVLQSHSFLDVLLQLASCVLTLQDTRMSASEMRHTSETNTSLGVVTPCDTAHWLALALLQRLNNDQDERGCHAWREALQQWLHGAFKKCMLNVAACGGKATPVAVAKIRDAVLGLAVLGGIPRLAVPGDTVKAILGTHLVAPVTLLRTLWSEEICEVLEVSGAETTTSTNAAFNPSETLSSLSSSYVVKKLPLRFVYVTIQGDAPATQTFPLKADPSHRTLVDAVAQLARHWFPLVSPVVVARVGLDVCCLVAQLSCLLLRCVKRKIIAVPPELIPSLSVVVGMTEEATLLDIDEVHLELMLSLWGLLRHRQRRGLPRGVSGAQGDREAGAGVGVERPVSSSVLGRGLVRVGSEASPEFTSASLRLRAFAALEMLHQRELSDGPVEPTMEYEDVDDNEAGAEEEGMEGDEDEAGMDMVRVFGRQEHRAPSGNDEDDDSEDTAGSSSTDVADRVGAAAADTTTMACFQSQLDASSTSDSFLQTAEREIFDTVHFNGGCVRVRSNMAAGLSFTVDLTLRLKDIERHQILFAQLLRGGTTVTSPSSPSTFSDVLELVARVVHGGVEFGWLPCYPGEEAQCDPAALTNICNFALTEEDLQGWMHVTFVQSGITLSLFRNGTLMDTRTMQSGGGPLLQEEFRLGGVPGQLDSTAFIGDIRNFRVYELALRPAMVEQLHQLNSSLSTFLDSHVVLALKATRRGVENASRALAVLVLDITTEGDVGYLDESGEAAVQRRHIHQACAQEVDFSAESEEAEMRPLSEPLPSQQSVLWRRKRDLPRDQLITSCNDYYRQLAAFHCAHVLVYALCQVAKSPVRLPSPMLQCVVEALKDETCVTRLTRWAVSTSSESMSVLLDEVWESLCENGGDDGWQTSRPNASALWEMGDLFLAELLRIAQLSQHLFTFESAHPQRPFASDVYEVHVPNQRCYSVFIDERSVARWRLVTVSRDRTMSGVMSEFYTTTLSSFEVRLPQFFVTVRSAAEAANWGHRLTVVHDYQLQLRAMRLFRSALSSILGASNTFSTTTTAYIWSVNCLMALHAVAHRNTSKTRLLALTCLNDLLLFGQHFDTALPPLMMPQLMHDMRHMAVRHYRRRLSAQRVLGRFIQLSMESYVMQRDAAQCWYAPHALKTHSINNGALPQGTFSAGKNVSMLEQQASALPSTQVGVSTDVVMAAVDEDAEVTRFAQQRQEQLYLYRQRGSMENRVSIQKLRVSPNFEHEWTPDGVCVLRSDGAGGSVIAGAPLTAGRWYFEARVGGAGNISIGVLPIPMPTGREQEMPFPLTRAALQDREPVVFNGCSGVVSNGAEQRRLFGPNVPPLWVNRDFLGVVIDVPAQCCTILVNGTEAVHFSFGAEAANERAAAAASFGDGASLSFMPSSYMGEFGSVRAVNDATAATGRAAPTYASSTSTVGVREFSASVAYYPYVSIEQGSSISLNFGAAYFEYEVPLGCLPLDPANLSLGTVFPYNQMRSLQDISAYLFTGGRYPLPPFYYEEADPFAGSTERVGPAHVSVHASADVQVNMEEVKNVGLNFETVMGDCAVSAGAWYYEVTLRTQGVLQIGWMERGETLHGNGHGVGDSSTSWAVDLFRRVMWHRGVPEPVNIPRRWTAGDVLGCAFDISHGELSFFLNGRPITGVLAFKAESSLLETCTFHGIPRGRYYVPAVSLRSGGAISFNFGSSPFKYKPDGFNPLGVPDSWNERMDTFYNNASASSTIHRLMMMQEVWRVLSRSHRALNRATGSGAADGGGVSCSSAPRSHSMVDLEAHLKPYHLIVQATDTFSDNGMKTFTKSSEERLRIHLETYAYPDTTDKEAVAIVEHSWEMFKVLKALSDVTNALLPFLSLNTTHPSLMTLLFLTIRTLLFRAVRCDLVESVLAVSSLRSEQYRVSINRAKAHANTKSVKASVFGQTFALLGNQPSRIFQTRQRYWSTVFLGEGAEDAGGPFREHLSEMCRELMSTRLPFFVPTANHVHNTGSHREAFVPAASACTPYDLEAFVFIGRLMGGAFRSEDPLDLFLPPLVWRYLCAYPITETEVEQVDAICMQCVREFRKLAASASGAQAEEDEGEGEGNGDEGSFTELFDDVFGEEYFVTQLSDHSTKELVDGGAQVRVTLQRSREYAEALLQARVHEFDVQLRKLREGLLSVVPEVAVLLLTPAELERRICGQPDYKPEELRKGASYEGLTSEDRRVQLLWKALESASPLQRRLFLRFVSGRDRLPVKLRVLPLTTQADPDTILPRAATCFFAIELPDYSSLDVMKRKLFYSIENCADMDTDFNARIVNEDETPQLSVALEEAQPDLMAQLNSDND